MKKVFAYLETKIVFTFSPIISVGSSFEHVGALRVIAKEGMWVRTGQVRIVRAVGDEDERWPSIDEPKARETERAW